MLMWRYEKFKLHEFERAMEFNLSDEQGLDLNLILTGIKMSFYWDCKLTYYKKQKNSWRDFFLVEANNLFFTYI